MINLLPNTVREERLYGRRNRVLVGYIIAFAGAAFLVAAVMIGSLRFVGADEDNIQQSIDDSQVQITALEAEISDLSAVVAKLNTTDKLYDSSIRFSELIPNIGSLLPQGSVLNGLSLTGGNTDPLTLDVALANADLAAVLQKNLVESELFEAADVNSISAGDETGVYRFSASVSASFTGSAEAKRKAAAAAAAAAQAAAEINGEDGGTPADAGGGQ